MKTEFRYILSGRDGTLRGEIPDDFHILNPSDKFVLSNSVADCLNAERNGADAVIWISEDYEQLEELSPIKREYGWMLVSINIPVILHITDIDQLNKIDNIKIDGFYSEDLSLLKETQKKMKSLPGE